jgi:hypothetical protein
MRRGLLATCYLCQGNWTQASELLQRAADHRVAGYVDQNQTLAWGAGALAFRMALIAGNNPGTLAPPFVCVVVVVGVVVVGGVTSSLLRGVQKPGYRSSA